MIKIDKKNIIARNQKPFIIAEMSANHNGSFKRAIKIVRKAAECGVSAIKLQTYTADTMTIKSKKKDFLVSDKQIKKFGKTLYDLYNKAHTPWEWHHKIFKEAKKNGLICFSTPFDESSVNFLKKLKPPIFKIASFENTDLRLIKQLARTKKPLIISLGMANLKEIEKTVKIARANGCKKLILLKCTSSYPAPLGDSNLNTIPYLRKKFNCEVGLSDHTLGTSAAVAAVSLGASVIEKHFTLDKKNKGVDESFSLNPEEMKKLVNQVNEAYESLGLVQIKASKSEKKNLKYRRSIYVVKNITKGESFSKSNVRCIRPGYGLPTIYYDKILKLKSKTKLLAGQPLSWKHTKKR